MHGVILGRRRYGTLGWCMPYEFTDSDLHISLRQLQEHLNEASQETKDHTKLFHYLILECNYGARITEPSDKKLLEVLMSSCCSAYSPAASVHSSNNSSAEEVYPGPAGTAYEDFQEYISELPEFMPTSVFGLHPNAEVSVAHKTSFDIFADLFRIPCSSLIERDADLESSAAALAQALLEQLPDTILFEIGHTTLFEDHILEVLKSEVSRYSYLLRIIRSSLDGTVRAYAGRCAIDAEIEAIIQQISCGLPPAAWLGCSYLSVKPLGGYISDLAARLSFMNCLMGSGPPPSFWLPGFFCINNFLTATLRSFALKKHHPIDLVKFDFKIPRDKPAQAADEGVLVHGMYLEGCRWQEEHCELTESEDKVLVAPCPAIWIVPAVELKVVAERHFYCPVYVAPSRCEILSRKSYQRNFVCEIPFPSSLHHSHWIRRGAAAVTQLSR